MALRYSNPSKQPVYSNLGGGIFSRRSKLFFFFFHISALLDITCATVSNLTTLKRIVLISLMASEHSSFVLLLLLLCWQKLYESLRIMILAFPPSLTSLRHIKKNGWGRLSFLLKWEAWNKIAFFFLIRLRVRCYLYTWCLELWLHLVTWD